MTVLIATCFISVVSGYINVNQIAAVDQLGPKVAILLADGTIVKDSGDKTPAEFMERVVKTCKVESK